MDSKYSVIVLAGLTAMFVVGGSSRAASVAPLSLEELLVTEIDKVSGASRIEQLITETPASVTVLTSKDIRRHGWRTLAEALRSVPGINTSYNHLYATATVRGQTSALDMGSFLLLLIDGERLTSNVSDASMIGDDMPIDLEWIDRIEIVTGASSAVYGANAALAVVNLITRPEEALDNVEGTLDVSGNDTRAWRLAGKKRFENGHIAVSASRLEGDGYMPEDQNLSKRAFARLALGDFIFTALRIERDKSYPLLTPPLIVEGHLNTRYGSATLGWRKELAPNLQANVSVQYGESEFTVGYGNPALLYRNYPTEGSWHGIDASLTQTMGNHTLLYGFDYMNSPDTHRTGYEATPLGKQHEFDHDVSFSRHALFFQDIWKFRPDLGLHVALRHERDERFDDTLLVPRLGLIYNHSPSSTFKLTYGESFRAHPAFEISSLPSALRDLMPDEPPEQVRQWEARVEHDLSPSTRIEGSLYRIETSDQLRFIPTLKSKFILGESSTLNGIEASMLWRAQDGSRLRASLTLQDGEFDSDNAPLYNSPERMVKIAYSRPIVGNDIFLGAELLHTGSRQTLLGEKVSAYSLTNLTFSSTPDDKRKWDWQVGVYNLFDTQYSDPSPYSLSLNEIEQEGRSWRVRFKLRF
jgi:iron complex outermembrane receptor protein